MAALGQMLCALASASVSKVATTSLKQIYSRCTTSVLTVAPSACQQTQQVRGRYIDWKMWRDVKRRQMSKEYAPERLRVNSLRRNRIIPQELQEVATAEIKAFPRDSNWTRIHDRCVVTSRPRGVQRRWRVSRIVWRHLADYNKMSGVTRAWW